MKSVTAFLALIAALIFAPSLTTPAQAQPCQWNYSDPGNVSTATYCGNVVIKGGVTIAGLPSVASLASVLLPFEGETFDVIGYSAGSKIGGGIFTYTTSIITPDGCDNFAASITGTWVRQRQQSLPVPLTNCDTLAHASARAAALGVSLILDTNVVLSADTTVTAALQCSGGVIDVNGHALSGLTSISGGAIQCFSDSAGTGSVSPGASFKGGTIYGENFGAGQGDATKDQTGMRLAAGFANASSRGVTIYKASQQDYNLCNTITFTTTTSAHSIRLSSYGMNSRINLTCDNVLFIWLGRPTTSPSHMQGSGFDNISIINSVPSNVNAIAAQFSDSTGYWNHDYQVAQFEEGVDILIKNQTGYTEEYTDENAVHTDSKICYQAQGSGTQTSSSMRGMDIRHAQCDFSHSLSGKYALFVADDGFPKSIYDCLIDITATAAPVGNYGYILVSNGGATSVVNELFGCTIRIRTDGIANNTGTDGIVLKAVNKTASALGYGIVQESTLEINPGATTQTLDLSTGAAPTVVPIMNALIAATDASGANVELPDGRSPIMVADLQMCVNVPIEANRAAYTWDTGFYPANQNFGVSVSGIINGSPGNAYYTYTSRGPLNNGGIQQNSLSGFEFTDITFPTATNGHLMIQFDNSTHAIAANVNVCIKTKGQ